MIRLAALFLGPFLLLVTALAPAPGSLTEASWRVAGLAGWMAAWWLTAVVPLEATALLPIVVLPLAGVAPVGDVTVRYADPIIFLFLGGFLLAATLERWDLHRRFALAAVRGIGTDAPRVVLAFMLASAVASMWISNTATTLMMLPIAGAVIAGRTSGGLKAGGATLARMPISTDRPTSRSGVVPSGGGAEAEGGFPTALMLGVAYGASIGGVATLIGTPPNAILAGAASDLVGREISFSSWLALGFPVAIPMLAGCWLLLIRLFRVRGTVAGLAQSVDREHRRMGTMSGAERFVLLVFALTALAWIFRLPKSIGAARIPGLADLWPGISDPAIAIGAALVLFVVPLPGARFPTALDWESAKKIPWGILLLFGGGLALASAFESSGLTEWLGGRLEALHGAPMIVVLFATSALFVMLTELTSNTATAALGMPLMVGVAQGVGMEALPLMVAAALAASMAFMLPVATPPNAIVFGSGAISSADMAKAGIGLNLLAMIVITLVVSLLGV
ncbi:MAG: SLC13 family permease [Gemmatimonadales bacterium]